MQLIVLGAGVGVPQKTRTSPSILLKIKKRHLLFDTGPGTLQQLARVGIHINQIEQIFYTHSHLDHVLEFPFFLFASKYPLEERKEALIVNASAKMKEFLHSFLSLFGEQIKINYPLIIKDVKEWEDEEIKIHTLPLAHRPESVGYRVEAEGKIFVYSGDTDYCREIVELADSCSLLALECSFPEGMKVDGHLTPSLCARIANEAKAEKLLLLHLYPVCEEEEIKEICSREFNGEVIVAHDLDCIHL